MYAAPPRVVGPLGMLLDGSRTHSQQRWVWVAVEFFRRQNCVQTVEAAEHLLPVRRELTVLTADGFANAETSQKPASTNHLK